ncbi:MAG: hypothetical protein K8L97_30660 [Anaerolineae bacterium]|nr:hypothetical protein [Anaerolineae bacterium]
MSLDIQPFSEEDNNLPLTGDSRTTSFMDELRARVADSDEKQRQKWAKAVKPAAKRKPITPARPEWLSAPKQRQAAAKPTTKPSSHPFGNLKKKRAETNSTNES